MPCPTSELMGQIVLCQLECPLWVKSGHKTTQLGMSALPLEADMLGTPP